MRGAYDETPSGRTTFAARPTPHLEAVAPRRQAPARPRRRLDLPTFVSLLYVSFLFAWQALRFTPVGIWPPFEVVDIFGLALFVPLPALLLVSLLAASRRAGLVLLLPLLLLAATYGPLFLPRTVPPIFRASSPPNGSTLRVMTANLLVVNDDRAAVLGTILAEQPDIVGLQEVSGAMAEYLADALRDRYPYQTIAPSEAPDGLGILSRYPIYQEPETGWYSHVCGCQRVRITRDGQTLSFFNVHPPPPAVTYARLGRVPVPTSFSTSLSQEVLHAALVDLDEWPRPIVVLGDFNLSDRQPLYRELRRSLEDAHAEAGWGLVYSFPSLSFEGVPDVSLVRIDYVMYDRSLVARSVRTGRMPGSDHRYVVVDLAPR